MSYGKEVMAYKAKGEIEVQVRTDYRCKAFGCPNAGSMERDLCFHHWAAGDTSKWQDITQSTRENFDKMRNWGEISSELHAKRKAASRARFGLTSHVPMGFHGGQLPTEAIKAKFDALKTKVTGQE